MHDLLIIDGVPLSNFGTYITDAGIFESPEPDYEEVEIEGRNGNLIISKGRFKNIDVTYPAFIYEDFEANYTALRAFLLSRKSSIRIEDTFITDKYRIGTVAGKNLTPKYPKEFSKGSFAITLNCKPQWFLNTGEETIKITNTAGNTASAKVFNPTYFNAKPLIRVYGSGTLGIGSDTITIEAGATEYIDIDCDIKDCYEGTENRNSLVSLTNWIELTEGANGILLGSGITEVDITPRWYTI